MGQASDRRLGVELLYEPATVFGDTRRLRRVVAVFGRLGNAVTGAYPCNFIMSMYNDIKRFEIQTVCETP